MLATNKLDDKTLNIALHKINTTFKELPAPNYLDGFQKWFQGRLADWQGTFLRIGLVGITSAGKSTFINALAGEDILPRAAQPTSGILVICRKASERKLTIYFQDGNKQEFAEEECDKEWVSRYADEKENPNNEQKVKEIQLSLPTIMIPEKYDMIDSPGLDAFGLGGHEELTLRTLIPLVDVVLFLTTTKSSSDKENLRALSNICKEAKPAIVIQTHKDAVEPRYMAGGKIVETTEQVLDKHRQRVRQLLEQTPTLQEAPILQVSSVQALNARLQNPGQFQDSPDWEESGFDEITEVLSELYDKVSQKVASRRIKLLYKELQKLIDKVRSDYNMARGNFEEAQRYKDSELKALQELQNSIPSEKTPDFPDMESVQNKVQDVKKYFLDIIENNSDEELENLSVKIRDKIKNIEKDFFKKSDILEENLKNIAKELAVDMESIKAQEQKHPSLPQLQHYERLVDVEIIEEVGLVGMAKRIFGKILKQKDIGYQKRELKKICIDRDVLKEDLLDYHGIYTLRLSNYLKRWKIHWINSVAAILTTISQKKDDLNSQDVKAGADPEPYHNFLNKVRALRDWFEVQLSTDKKSRFTMGIKSIKKAKKKQLTLTTRTKNQMNLMLPLLQTLRTIYFNRKTHRFWYLINNLIATPSKSKLTILVSTPFSQETSNYFNMIGDIEQVDDNVFVKSPIIYSLDKFEVEQDYNIPIKHIHVCEEDNRVSWFLKKNNIILFHDEILNSSGGTELFSCLMDKSDVVFRMIDIHQIGHEKKRLDKLIIRNKLEKAKNKLGYIGFGAKQLIKSDQAVDIYKSYNSLKKFPGFGLKPMVLADGEDIFNSLLWLSCSLTKENTITDELEAMNILNKTHEQFIQGKQVFIRNFFSEVKENKREEEFYDKLTS